MEDTSTYGFYSLIDLRETPPEVIGGRNRAAAARRDQHGRFMPDDLRDIPWRLDPEHGRKAGQINAATCRRNNHGKFAAKEPGQ